MNALTTSMTFEIPEIEEQVTIERSKSGIWGYEFTGGLHSWGGRDYKSFDSCYRDVKRNANDLIKEARIEKGMES